MRCKFANALHIILGKLTATIQGLQRWKKPDTSLSLQRSGSLVLAHLQILTRQTQLWSGFLLQRSKDLARKCNFGGALSNTRVNCIPLITKASFGLCKADVRQRSAHHVHIQPYQHPARAISWADRSLSSQDASSCGFTVFDHMVSIWLSLKERLYWLLSVTPPADESYLAASTGCCTPSPKPGGKAPRAAWTDGLPPSGQGPAGGCSGAPGLRHDFGWVPEPALNMGHQ